MNCVLPHFLPPKSERAEERMKKSNGSRRIQDEIKCSHRKRRLLCFPSFHSCGELRRGGSYSLPLPLLSLSVPVTHHPLPPTQASSHSFLSFSSLFCLPSLLFQTLYLWRVKKIQGWDQMKERKEIADQSLLQAVGRGREDL